MHADKALDHYLRFRLVNPVEAIRAIKTITEARTFLLLLHTKGELYKIIFRDEEKARNMFLTLTDTDDYFFKMNTVYETRQDEWVMLVDM